jgi:hypothetical protein
MFNLKYPAFGLAGAQAGRIIFFRVHPVGIRSVVLAM